MATIIRRSAYWAAASQDITGSVEELKGLAHNMEGLVQKFKAWPPIIQPRAVGKKITVRIRRIEAG
jgi:hypothetical protein